REERRLDRPELRLATRAAEVAAVCRAIAAPARERAIDLDVEGAERVHSAVVVARAARRGNAGCKCRFQHGNPTQSETYFIGPKCHFSYPDFEHCLRPYGEYRGH